MSDYTPEQAAAVREVFDSTDLAVGIDRLRTAGIFIPRDLESDLQRIRRDAVKSGLRFEIVVKRPRSCRKRP
jgi:hypothetical protein